MSTKAEWEPEEFVPEYVEAPRQKRPGLYIDFVMARITAQNYRDENPAFFQQKRKVKQIRALFTAWIRDTGRAWEYGAADEPTYRDFDLWLLANRPVVAALYRITPRGGIAFRADGEKARLRPGMIWPYILRPGAWDNLGRLKTEAGRTPAAEEVPLLTVEQAEEISGEMLVTVWHRSRSGRVYSMDCFDPAEIRWSEAARDKHLAEGALPEWRYTRRRIRQLRRQLDSEQEH